MQLFLPRLFLNHLKKEVIDYEIIANEDMKMLNRIRIHGAFYTIIGIAYLTMELNGFLFHQAKIYDIFLSLVVLAIGIKLYLLPLYAPTNNSEEKKRRIKKAKKTGLLFIGIGILFLIWDYFRFF